MRWSSKRALVGGMVVVLGGCNALLGIDPPITAAADGGAPPPETVSKENLLANPRFDRGCLLWDGSAVEVKAVPGGRTGEACQVCPKDRTTNLYFIHQVVLASKFTPGTYDFEFWVHHANVITAPAKNAEVGAELIIESDQFSDPLKRSTTPPVRTDDTWQKVSVGLVYEVLEGGVEVDVQIIVRDVGDCFLVDDAVLSRL